MKINMSIKTCTCSVNFILEKEYNRQMRSAMAVYNHRYYNIYGIMKKSAAVVEYGILRLEKATLTPQQVDAVRHVYIGKEVFLWLPTGFGKSVCYELLPFVMDYKRGKSGNGQESYSTALVVSPLVSLMIDQVTSLRKRGGGGGVVTAGILSSHPGV